MRRASLGADDGLIGSRICGHPSADETAKRFAAFLRSGTSRWPPIGGRYRPTPRSPMGHIERAYRKRAESFASELKRLRKVCAGAIDPGFGFHPNFDPVKNHCAWFAHGLIRELSHRKISGTKDGTFWTITSLLYEAVSGQKNAALKRACDSVLRNIRGRELGTD
jgi:hypothetical protein